MNIISTDEFYAARQTNGEVWIRHGKHYWRQATIKIPKEHCRELAELLLHYTPELDNKVDYSRCAGEPE